MSYLSEVSPIEAQKTIALINECKDDRITNREARRGMSKDKSKRLAMRFPMWFVFHPEYSKFFDKNMDKHENRKAMKFLWDNFPEFRVVDKF